METTIYCPKLDSDITVEFNYTQAEKPVCYLSNWDPGYPGCPAEVDVLAVFDEDGNEIEEDQLSNDEVESLLWDNSDTWMINESDFI